MVTHPTTFPHIVRHPKILSGEPIVAGTRVSVRTVVLMHRLYKDFAGVQQALPHLSQADIEEALRYYKSNLAEIERYIAQNDVDEDLLHENL
ncbi:MAG: DUF433 domain-containing protein [Chloroflexota bacterium]|nr:DUF433 domain-containing protein [Chloroflexota bacterium]